MARISGAPARRLPWRGAAAATDGRGGSPPSVLTSRSARLARGRVVKVRLTAPARLTRVIVELRRGRTRGRLAAPELARGRAARRPSGSRCAAPAACAGSRCGSARRASPTGSASRSRRRDAGGLDDLSDRALERRDVLDRDPLGGVAVAAADRIEHGPLLGDDVVELRRQRRDSASSPRAGSAARGSGTGRASRPGTGSWSCDRRSDGCRDPRAAASCSRHGR